MHSRVHPTYKTGYRVANWAAYDRALVGRGDITPWMSPEAIDTWEPVGVGTRGGQQKYSDVAIATALTLRLLFHLPLRQAEGFLQSLFGMALVHGSCTNALASDCSRRRRASVGESARAAAGGITTADGTTHVTRGRV